MTRLEIFRTMQRLLKPSAYVHFNKLCAYHTDECLWAHSHGEVYEISRLESKDGKAHTI